MQPDLEEDCFWVQYLVRRSCRKVFRCTRELSSSTNLNNSTVLFWWGWFTTKRYTVSSWKGNGNSWILCKILCGWVPPALRQPRAQSTCWVWCIFVMALQRQRDKYPHSARCLCNRIQISSYLCPRLAPQGTAVLTRFLLFLPPSSLYPSHWVLQSVKQPQSAGRRVCGQGSLGSWVCLPHPLEQQKEHPSPAFYGRLQPTCPALLVGPYISHHWSFQHLPLKDDCVGMQVKLQQLFSLYLQNSNCPAKTPSERTRKKVLYW